MSTMQETSTLLEKIRSRGYWRVVIRPLTFKRERIARLQDLFPIVQRCTVPFHTWWEYPQIEARNRPCTAATGSDRNPTGESTWESGDSIKAASLFTSLRFQRIGEMFTLGRYGKKIGPQARSFITYKPIIAS